MFWPDWSAWSNLVYHTPSAPSLNLMSYRRLAQKLKVCACTEQALSTFVGNLLAAAWRLAWFTSSRALQKTRWRGRRRLLLHFHESGTQHRWHNRLLSTSKTCQCSFWPSCISCWPVISATAVVHSEDRVFYLMRTKPWKKMAKWTFMFVRFCWISRLQ